MNSVATLDPDFVSALEEAVGVLRSVAEYELEDDLQQRLRQLGENKDDWPDDDRDEHRQLADFRRRQTLRRFQALNALHRLRETAPELVGNLPEAPDPS